VTRFTLDTACLTALKEKRPEAEAIRALVAAHEAGHAHVAIVAMRASDTQAKDFQGFQSRLESLGLCQIELLQPMAYYDISFPDWCVFPTEELEDIEREIHSILFPSIQYAWIDFRKANQIEDAVPPVDSPWRRAKCDVQSILAHMENERDVFVASAEIFHREIKKRQLIALGARAIEYPAEAAGMI
jgi:hypothetical protein